MTPKEQQEKCRKCNFVQRTVAAEPEFIFLGCMHEPYKGKWVAEIEKCPIGIYTYKCLVCGKPIETNNKYYCPDCKPKLR